MQSGILVSQSVVARLQHAGEAGVDFFATSGKS
jgi:hypothetical protein